MSYFYCVAVLTLKPETDDMMSPLIFTMLKIIWYARKQGCFVMLPFIFVWHAGGWNNMQRSRSITPAFVFQSNFVAKGQLYVFPVLFLPSWIFFVLGKWNVLIWLLLFSLFQLVEVLKTSLLEPEMDNTGF